MKWIIVFISAILIIILWLPKNISHKITQIIKTYNSIFAIEERWHKHISSTRNAFESDFTYIMYSITMAFCLIFYYFYYFVIYIFTVITGKEDSFRV